MHIALISQDYPPETLMSGIGTYTKALAHCLVNLGHEVTVITWAVEQPWVDDDSGVHVHRILPFGSRVIGRHRLVLPLRSSLGLYRHVCAVHADNPVDVVEFHDSNGVGGITAAFGRLPSVARGHGSFEMSLLLENVQGGGLRRRLLCTIESLGLRHADLVVTVSDFVKGLYRDLYGLSPDLLITQPLALSAPASFQQARHPMHGADACKEDCTFLYCGRQEWRKRPHVVVQAFARLGLAHKRLVIIGDDTDTAPGGTSMRQYCLNLARDLGIVDHVQMVNRVPQEELLHYYLASDVLVAPSLYETFGLVYLEAMAVGLPVIGSTMGASPEIITPETGILVPPDDVDSLARAMETLGRHPELRRAMGAAGQRLVHEKYTPEQHATAMLGWYERAIAHHRNRRRRSLARHLIAIGGKAWHRSRRGKRFER